MMNQLNKLQSVTLSNAIDMIKTTGKSSITARVQPQLNLMKKKQSNQYAKSTLAVIGDATGSVTVTFWGPRCEQLRDHLTETSTEWVTIVGLYCTDGVSHGNSPSKTPISAKALFSIPDKFPVFFIRNTTSGGCNANMVDRVNSQKSSLQDISDMKTMYSISADVHAVKRKVVNGASILELQVADATGQAILTVWNPSNQFDNELAIQHIEASYVRKCQPFQGVQSISCTTSTEFEISFRQVTGCAKKPRTETVSEGDL